MIEDDVAAVRAGTKMSSLSPITMEMSLTLSSEYLARSICPAGLGVAELRAVIADAGVLWTETAYGYCLQTSRAAIITEYDARHTVNGIRNARDAHLVEVPVGYRVSRCYGHYLLRRFGRGDFKSLEYDRCAVGLSRCAD